jgi:hypothetical protein
MKRTTYSPKIASRILERIAAGESLRSICKENSMPSFQSVLAWASDDKDGFRDKYTLAMDVRAQGLFDEMLEISDSALPAATGAPGTGEAGARVAAIKLKVDTLKWILAKMQPKRYGDKITQEISGPDGGPVRTESDHRPSPDDVAAFSSDLFQGFMGYVDEKSGKTARLDDQSIASLSELISNYSAGGQMHGNEPSETGMRFARGWFIRENLRPPASFEGQISEP